MRRADGSTARALRPCRGARPDQRAGPAENWRLYGRCRRRAVCMKSWRRSVWGLSLAHITQRGRRPFCSIWTGSLAMQEAALAAVRGSGRGGARARPGIAAAHRRRRADRDPRPDQDSKGDRHEPKTRPTPSHGGATSRRARAPKCRLDAALYARAMSAPTGFPVALPSSGGGWRRTSVDRLFFPEVETCFLSVRCRLSGFAFAGTGHAENLVLHQNG